MPNPGMKGFAGKADVTAAGKVSAGKVDTSKTSKT